MAGHSGWITAALYSVAMVNLALAMLVAHAATTRTAQVHVGKLNSKRHEENRVFAFVLFCISAWALSNAFFHQALSIPAALFWAKFAYGPALLTAASFFHFSRAYPRRDPFSPGGKVLLYGTAVAIAALAFVPEVMVHQVVEDAVGGRRLLTGNGIYLVAAYMLGVSAAAFALFWRNQRRLRGRYQAQARYVLFGSALTAVPGLCFNLLLPLFGNYHFVQLGPLGSVFVVGFITYSILTQKLFDVRILIRRTVVYTVYLAAFAGAFAAFAKGLEHIVSPLFGDENSYATGIITALVVGAVLDPLKRHLHKLASKKLFRGELVDSHDQLDD